MCRADRSLNTLFNTKSQMPQHIGKTAHGEAQQAHKSEAISFWKRMAHVVASQVIPHLCVDNKAHKQRGTGVQDSVPGRKESFKLGNIVMRPGIEIGTKHEPARKQCNRPVKAVAGDGPILYHTNFLLDRSMCPSRLYKSC